MKSALTVAACLLPAALACVSGAPDPKVVQASEDSLKLTLCMLDHYAQDKQAGMSDVDIAVDVAAQCSADVVQVGRVLAAHKRASAAERAPSDAGRE